jgi:hypothetical protein
VEDAEAESFFPSDFAGDESGDFDEESDPPDVSLLVSLEDGLL